MTEDTNLHTGWLTARRVVGKIAFLVLRDDRTTRQLVVRDSELIERVRRLPVHSLIRVRAVTDGIEWELLDVITLVEAPALPFPIDHKGQEPALRTLLQHPALRFRRAAEQVVVRLNDEILSSLRRRLEEHRFVEVLTPRFLGNPPEGGAALLRVGYFDDEVFLSQSTQLYRQMLLPDLSRVFELTSIFRGDRHATSWHLNEFAAMEVEWDGIADHHTVIDLAEDLIRAAMTDIRAAMGDTLAEADVDLPTLPDTIPRVSYRDALKILSEEYGVDRENNFNLTATGNRLLCEWVRRHWQSDFVVLVGTPVRHAQFYDMIDPDNPGYTRCFVILCRGTSFVCGGQRMHELSGYQMSLAQRGAPTEPLADYLAAIGRGMAPHGGFSLAMARFIATLCEMNNVRKAVMFPRDSETLVP